MDRRFVANEEFKCRFGKYVKGGGYTLREGNDILAPFTAKWEKEGKITFLDKMPEEEKEGLSMQAKAPAMSVSINVGDGEK